MALKKRIEKLHKKLPEKEEPYQMSWYDPETGETWYRMTVIPLGNGKTRTIEEWPEEGRREVREK